MACGRYTLQAPLPHEDVAAFTPCHPAHDICAVVSIYAIQPIHVRTWITQEVYQCTRICEYAVADILAQLLSSCSCVGFTCGHPAHGGRAVTSISAI